ncbi:putative thioredoxin [Agromyces terreus]|uniref:Thioredoxin n=1 Tax=Agromyces terreus TaxID=424795 RepID=A0A9X2GZV5_9MICO|nr:tetratricopeptide repeat protein [Agromyces terreus]MCP2372195.1 putative thioredoxin [Agromyces terreus]
MTDPTPHAALRGAIDLSSLVQRPQQQSPAGAETAPGGDPVVFQTDDAGFGAVLELSRTVPVVVAVWASWSEPSTGLVEALERLVRARGGRLVLAAADADRSPQLVQAFQVQSVPTVVALVAGQPVPLFAGVQPDEVVDQVFDQLLELASQHGVTGSVQAPEGDAPEAEQAPAEPPLPPLHQEAYDAIERGDFTAAASAYRTAIAQDPRDQMAIAGLAQANLLGRLSGKTLDAVRNAAAAGPDDLQAQLDVADLDLSGGHVDDAFDRLLSMFPKLDADQKKLVRERLVELFEVVGTDDPRVAVARRRLTNLLF